MLFSLHKNKMHDNLFKVSLRNGSFDGESNLSERSVIHFYETFASIAAALISVRLVLSIAIWQYNIDPNNTCEECFANFFMMDVIWNLGAQYYLLNTNSYYFFSPVFHTQYVSVCMAND